MKVAFLDRDGTINLDYSDSEWENISYPELLDGSLQGLKYLIEKGYKLIILTNQYIIGEGIITFTQYENFTKALLEILNKNGIEIFDIFYCPHARCENCSCCKPQIGLLNQALSKYPEIEVEKSFMCGDSLSDLEFAKRAGLKFYGIKIGKESIKNLSEIKKFI